MLDAAGVSFEAQPETMLSDFDLNIIDVYIDGRPLQLVKRQQRLARDVVRLAAVLHEPVTDDSRRLVRLEDDNAATFYVPLARVDLASGDRFVTVAASDVPLLRMGERILTGDPTVRLTNRDMRAVQMGTADRA